MDREAPGAFRWAAIAERVFIGNDAWLPGQITGLEATDFTTHTWAAPGQPANPDFSAAGLPIAFGVTTGASCPASADCSGPAIPVAVDIDNWQVTVDSEPAKPFVVDNGCKELFMSPGESCLMRVIFRPDEPGFVANALTILFGSDLDSRFSETILLTGSTAIESPKASFPRPKKSTSSTGPSVC